MNISSPPPSPGLLDLKETSSRIWLPTIAGFLTGLLIFLGISLFNKTVLDVSDIKLYLLPVIVVIPVMELIIRKNVQLVLSRTFGIAAGLVFLYIWAHKSATPVILAEIVTKDVGIYAFIAILFLATTMVDLLTMRPQTEWMLVLVVVLHLCISFMHRTDISTVGMRWPTILVVIQNLIFISMIWVVIIDYFLLGLWAKQITKTVGRHGHRA